MAGAKLGFALLELGAGALAIALATLVAARAIYLRYQKAFFIGLHRDRCTLVTDSHTG